MGLVNKPFNLQAGSQIQASDHNSNFDTLYTLVNGQLDNTNIKTGAGIEEAKITFSGSGHNHSGGANGNPISISALTISGQTKGDIIYYTGTLWARLGTGAAGTYLTMSSGLPTWL